MQLEIIVLRKVSQKEKDTLHDITCMWNSKKMIQTIPKLYVPTGESLIRSFIARFKNGVADKD